MSYECRPIKWAIGPASEPLFSERVTIVSIEDEAGGEFVVIEQQTDQPHDQRIAINPDEWPMLRTAIDYAVQACRDAEAQDADA
jgi:hypothetical protein